MIVDSQRGGGGGGARTKTTVKMKTMKLMDSADGVGGGEGRRVGQEEIENQSKPYTVDAAVPRARGGGGVSFLSPSKMMNRSFGDEMVGYMNVDTSVLEFKDTDVTADDTLSTSDYGEGGEAAEGGGGESGSVTVLRECPNDVSQQKKNHRFEKTKIPSFSTASMDALATTNQVKEKPSRTVPQARASISLAVNHHGKLKPTYHRSYTTPVRIKPKVEASEVQATNDGYASVAKLSAWLADDPTRNKPRVRQIRRGANVIAKSRKFDKGLANVKVIESAQIRPGYVTEKKHLIEHAFSEDEVSSTTSSSTRLNTASVVSVQDKREWLGGAFKKKSVGKAQTDIGTSQDAVEDVTARAKQMWRQRTPPRKTEAHSASVIAPMSMPIKQLVTTPNKNGSVTKQDTLSFVSSSPAMTPNRQTKVSHDVSSAVSGMIDSIVVLPVPSTLDSDTTSMKEDDDNTSLMSFEMPTELSAQRETVIKSSPARFSPARFDNNELNNNRLTVSPVPTNTTRIEELKQVRSSGLVRKTADIFVKKVADPVLPPQADDNEEILNFQAARDLLVKRSQQNGNAVEVISKVGRRKALFEKMQMDNRRKSMAHGHLKPSWQQEDTAGGILNKYKKTYVSDIVPKKSFEELP